MSPTFLKLVRYLRRLGYATAEQVLSDIADKALEQTEDGGREEGLDPRNGNGPNQ